MADLYCIIPHFLAYKVSKSSNSVRIRFNQAEESKYEILIPFEYSRSRNPFMWVSNRYISKNVPFFGTYMSAILDFYDLYQF